MPCRRLPSISSTPLGAARVMLLAASFSLLAACAVFPRHEEVWTPIPTRLGERHVAGADTVWVLAEPGAGYELAALDRERLPDAKSELDLTARAYRRYFGGDPKPVALLLLDSLAQVGRIDTAGYRARGYPVVPIAQPAKRRGSRPEYQSRPLGGPLSASAARAWIRARAGDGVQLPPWILLGATTVVGEPGFEQGAALVLRRKGKYVMPLDTIFAATWAEPAAVPPGGKPPKVSNAARDSALVFRAQAASLTEFLTERSGPLVIARLVDAYRTTQRPDSVLAAAGVTPSRPDSLDTLWRAWLAQRQRAIGIRPEGIR